MREFENISLEQVLDALHFLVVRGVDKMPQQHGVITAAVTFIHKNKQVLQEIDGLVKQEPKAKRMLNPKLGGVGSLVAAVAKMIDPLDTVVFLVDSYNNGFLTEAIGLISELYSKQLGVSLTMEDVGAIMSLHIVEKYPFVLAIPSVVYRGNDGTVDTVALGSSLKPLKLRLEDL